MQANKVDKFDCQDILDEIELAYQDMSDALGLPFDKMNHRLNRTLLQTLMEDVLNRATSAKFREPRNLTEDTICIYLENEINLDNIDREDIRELFVQPLLEEVRTKLGNLIPTRDRYYSKWEVTEAEKFPIMSVTYLGDYRIDDWHRIQDVPVKAIVANKQHNIRLKPLGDAIRYNLRHVEDLAINDVPLLIDKIIAYYLGKQVDELYKEIILQLKVINGFAHNEESRKCMKQAKSIIKSIESIPAFAAFVEDISGAEKIYSSQTPTRIVFDLIQPCKSGYKAEQRAAILDEIDQKGFVEKDILGKVESFFG